MIEESGFDYDMEKFIDDICICMYGKVKTHKSLEEGWVVSQSRSRLLIHGQKLMIARSTQMKYDGLKQNVETFKQICREDGIQLKD